jgi:peroxiredoxin
VAALVALVAIFGYWYWRSPESTKIRAGMTAPDLELQSATGKGRLRLSSLRGRPVLLVFFMSSCHICDKDVPKIDRLFREYRSEGLMVVGVSVDANYADRQRFLLEKHVTFAVVQDPYGDAVYEAYGSRKMPEAYLIDAEGRVDRVYLGAVDWLGDEVRDRIRNLLPRSAPTAPTR